MFCTGIRKEQLQARLRGSETTPSQTQSDQRKHNHCAQRKSLRRALQRAKSPEPFPHQQETPGAARYPRAGAEAPSGWIAAIPVPLLLAWAPTWNGILIANALLGVSQGLTWSTTVIMKIDLVGHERRGLAMGLNEFAGYVAVAGAALLTGWIAARYGLRPDPFYPGVVFVAVGLTLSALMVRETHAHVALESRFRGESAQAVSPREVFWRTTVTDRNLSSISQAGLVNNLNDGMAWGLFPLVFAAANLSLDRIGILAAIYPATWGIVQLATGALSDRVGRKWLIATGMWVQAVGISVVTLSRGFVGFATGGVLLGIGTAMVYPTLLAAIGDVAAPAWRASSVGVYRLWRDLGYALGALLAGVTADVVGLAGAMWVIAAITAAMVTSATGRFVMR